MADADHPSQLTTVGAFVLAFLLTFLGVGAHLIAVHALPQLLERAPHHTTEPADESYLPQNA